MKVYAWGFDRSDWQSSVEMYLNLVNIYCNHVSSYITSREWFWWFQSGDIGVSDKECPKTFAREKNIKKSLVMWKMLLGGVNWEILFYPLHSPDIALSDFHLFRFMQSGGYFTSYEMIEKLAYWINGSNQKNPIFIVE